MKTKNLMKEQLQTINNEIMAAVHIEKRTEHISHSPLLNLFKQAYLMDDENVFRMLVEKSYEGIWIINDYEETVYTNPRLCEMLGYSKEELFGRVYTDFIKINDNNTFDEDANKKVFGQNEVKDVKLSRNDSSVFWAQVTITPLYDDGCIIGKMVMLCDITERKRIEEKLRYLSQRDPLTGLYNRDALKNELNRINHTKEFPVILLFADLDGLKDINDTKGHLAGDLYLQKTAHILKSAFRKNDLIARVGGDEFCVVITQTDIEQAKSLFKRVDTNVKELRTKKAFADYSLSIGVVYEDKPFQISKLINEADHRMYLAKRKGSEEIKL